MNEIVANIIHSYSNKFAETKIFIAPDIPPKKLKNAIKAYAPGLAENEVLLLEDATLFGSAKDGLLMTDETLFVHAMLEKPWKIAIGDIQSLVLEEYDDPAIDSVVVRVNGPSPEGKVILVITEDEARLFAGMLKEIQAVLVPSGANSAKSELVVTLIARVPRLFFVRMVPVEGGRLRRYNFINLPLRGKEYGKVVNSREGLFISPKIILEMKDNKVYARMEGKNVFVNGEALVGTRELFDRDRIGLGIGLNAVEYQYQTDPKAAKQSRQKEEEAQGIVRHSGAEKPEVVLTSKFTVTPKGIKLVDGSGGKMLDWEQVDEVTFTADYDFIYKATTNLGNAAGQGLAIGSAVAESFLISQRDSDHKAVFPAPFYTVEFLSKGGSVGKLEQVDQRSCTMLDNGIELFAPIDLVKFK